MAKSSINQKNLSRVFSSLYRSRKTSRAEIARMTGLTPAAVTHVISWLIEKGLVTETGEELRDFKGSGRASKAIELNGAYGLFLGLELNQSGLSLAVTDLLGEKIYESFCIEPLTHGAIYQKAKEMIEEAKGKLDGKPILAYGLSVPGYFDEDSESFYTNNPKWKDFDLKKILSLFDESYFVSNNIKALALSEYLFDASPERFLYLHIGAGIVGAYFREAGFDRSPQIELGEIGHTVSDPHGPLCECGKRGCLQTFASDSWLIEKGQFIFENSETSILRALVSSADEIDLEVLLKAYALGDSYLQGLIDEAVRMMATAAANTLIMHDIEKIYISSTLLTDDGLYAVFKENLLSQLNFLPQKAGIEFERLNPKKVNRAVGACATAAYHYFILDESFIANL